MPHAKSLRAIGQSLETLGLSSFVLEKRGLAFILHSDALPDLTELGKKESLRKGLGVESNVAPHRAPGSRRRRSRIRYQLHRLDRRPRTTQTAQARFRAGHRNQTAVATDAHPGTPPGPRRTPRAQNIVEPNHGRIGVCD